MIAIKANAININYWKQMMSLLINLQHNENWESLFNSHDVQSKIDRSKFPY